MFIINSYFTGWSYFSSPTRQLSLKIFVGKSEDEDLLFIPTIGGGQYQKFGFDLKPRNTRDKINSIDIVQLLKPLKTYSSISLNIHDEINNT